MPTSISGSIGLDHYRATLHTARHTVYADEAVTNGGADTAPAPGEILLCSLAACKLITVRMYADRKAWPLGAVSAELDMTVDNSVRPVQTTIQCRMRFEGELDAEQRQRLLEIADKCPTHRILTGEISIQSVQES